MVNKDNKKYFFDNRNMKLKKYEQTLFYNKELNQRGDCLRACLSTLLQINPNTLPNYTRISDYLELEEIYFNYTGFYTVGSLDSLKDEKGINGLFIAYGKSSRDCLHAIIIDKQGNVFHDPHPSKEGIKKIENIYIIEKL